MSGRPANSLTTLNTARRAAATTRARWLMGVHTGEVSIHDVLRAAATTRHKALLRVSLRQLLIAQVGWGPKSATRILSHVQAVADSSSTVASMSIGWLLDPRAGGRRFAAWEDAFASKDCPPWPGFPHARSTRDV
ncbi:hypothetical protein V6N00_13865 [Tersicoccus sp. MR15.9]|uniref:hypothetical protein n=1 Tax=Tersicoccus mangrovi TaxID=3121635 RepID=UPI002FE4FF0C